MLIEATTPLFELTKKVRREHNCVTKMVLTEPFFCIHKEVSTTALGHPRFNGFLGTISLSKMKNSNKKVVFFFFLMYLTPLLGSEQRHTVKSRNLHKMLPFVPHEC